MDAVNRSLEDQLPGARRPCSSSFTATARGTSPTRPKRCRSWRPTAAGAGSSGRRGSRIARGCGRRATTRYYAALAALRPSARAWTTDVCVPISRLADCVIETTRGRHAGASFPICAGRSCRRRQFPPPLRARSGQPGRNRRGATRLNDRLVRRALAMGGTCTGEHGVGMRQDALSRSRARRARSTSCAPSSARWIRQPHEPGQDAPGSRRRRQPIAG